MSSSTAPDSFDIAVTASEAEESLIPELSTNKKIFSALVTVGSWTLIVKLLVLIKDALIAQKFGISEQLDTFYAASILPQFAIGLVGGAVYATFVPVLVREWKTSGRESTQRFLGISISVSLTLLLIAAILTRLFGPWYLVHGGTRGGHGLELSISLLLLLLPTIITNGLGILWSGVLNTTGKFAAAAAIPTITTTILIILLALQGHAPSIQVLVWGTVSGSFLEMCLLGFLLHRQGWKLTPGALRFDDETLDIFRKFLPMALGNLIMTTNPVIDQSFAAALGPGSIASLQFGNKLVSGVTGVASLAISRAVLPQVSELLAKKNFIAATQTMKFYSKAILGLSIPATLLMIAISVPVVQIVFEHGAFTHSNTLRVARIQMGYLAQIPFFLTGTLLLQGILAEGNTASILKMSVVACIVNFSLDYLLIRWIGIVGISLSTAGVYAINCMYLAHTFRSAMRNKLNLPAPED